MKIKFFLLIALFSLFGSIMQVQGQTKEWSNVTKGNHSFKQREFSKAEKDYMLALQQDSSNVVARYNLGNADFGKGNYDEALKNYNHILKYNPQTDKIVTSNVYHNIGVIQQTQANEQHDLMQQQKLLRNAIDSYKEALRINPNSEKSRYNMVLCQKQLKDLPKDQNSNSNKDNKDNNQKQDKKEQDAQQPKQNQDDNKKKDEQTVPQSKEKDKQTQNLLNYIRHREQQTKEKIKRQEHINTRNKIKNW